MTPKKIRTAKYDEFTGQEDYDAIGRGKEDEDEENPDDPEKKKDDPNATDKNKDGAKDGKDKDGKKDEKKKDEKKDGGEELEKAKQAAAPPIKKWKRFEPMWTLTEVKRFAVHILTSPVLKRAIKKMPAHPAVKVIVPIAFHFLPAFVEKIESADPFIEPWGEIAFKIIVLGKPEIRITLDNAERLWKMLESRKELQSD